jgi:hypothetical protein
LREAPRCCCIVALDVAARRIVPFSRPTGPVVTSDDLEERMTREEALAIVQQIEGLASRARRDDSGAQDDILYLVEQLREAPGVQDVVREKVASIAAWTDILFSDRKRATYGGDEEVTELLLHDCERLRAAIRGD